VKKRKNHLKEKKKMLKKENMPPFATIGFATIVAWERENGEPPLGGEPRG
jgi:hypothetical protein